MKNTPTTAHRRADGHPSDAAPPPSAVAEVRRPRCLLEPTRRRYRRGVTSDILVREIILVRVLIQFDKNNFSLVLVLVRQKI